MSTVLSDTADLARRSPVPLTVAAWASLGAGTIHAAAAGAHNEHPRLAFAFTAAAAVQIGWAVWVIARSPRPRPAALIGSGLSVVAMGAWLVSRTVGLGDWSGSSEAEEIGFSDASAAALALVTLVACALGVRARSVPSALAADHRTGPRRSLAVVAPVLALALAAPAVALAGRHGGDDHGTTGSHDAVIDPLDQPGVSEEQRARAQALIDATRAAAPGLSDPAEVTKLGFRSIGDGFTGYEHFVQRDYQDDPDVLNAEKPESLVFRVTDDGTRTLASAMYILPGGSTLADVPDVGGTLTPWHDHQDLCWDDEGHVVGQVVDGACQPEGTFRATAPMLHVWVTEHPCGPFAGIETDSAASSMPGGCLHGHGENGTSPTTAPAIAAGRRDVMKRYVGCLRIWGVSVTDGPSRLALATLNFRDEAILRAHDQCDALMPPRVAELLGITIT